MGKRPRVTFPEGARLMTAEEIEAVMEAGRKSAAARATSGNRLLSDLGIEPDHADDGASFRVQLKIFDSHLAAAKAQGMDLAARIVDECERGEHGGLANAARAIRAAAAKETP